MMRLARTLSLLKAKPWLEQAFASQAAPTSPSISHYELCLVLRAQENRRLDRQTV
jgi:hypothetical protein